MVNRATGRIIDTQSKRSKVHWLDKEPDTKSNGYETFIREEMQLFEEKPTFTKVYRPPTEDDYNRLRKEAYVDNASVMM